MYHTGTGNEIGETDPAFQKLHGDELKNDNTRWIDSAVWQYAALACIVSRPMTSADALLFRFPPAARLTHGKRYPG